MTEFTSNDGGQAFSVEQSQQPILPSQDQDLSAFTPEQPPKSRGEILFEPFPNVESDSQAPEEDYSYLFIADDAEFEKVWQAKTANTRTRETDQKEAFEKRGQVTEESLSQAEYKFRNVLRDPVIASSVDEYKKQHPGVFRDRDLMAALRTDRNLRLAIGNRLLDVANAYPYGISREAKKAPKHIGYAHISQLTPIEYAALLSLAMIDGTFKPVSEGFSVQYSRTMSVENGRHRLAAQAILNRPQDWQEWSERYKRITGQTSA